MRTKEPFIRLCGFRGYRSYCFTYFFENSLPQNSERLDRIRYRIVPNMKSVTSKYPFLVAGPFVQGSLVRVVLSNKTGCVNIKI
jgi:hypothetical protein